MAGLTATEACLWRQEADRFDRMLEGYGHALLDAARLDPGDHVLDVGCGAGATALSVGDVVGPEGHALGIDINASLIDVARARSNHRQGVGFVADDAATHPYRGSFDAIVSRFGMMLFEDLGAAFRHILAHLKPRGSVTYTTWTRPQDNGWYALPFRAMGLPVPEAKVGPFTLQSPADNTDLLRAAGCDYVTIKTRHEDVWVAADPADASNFLRGSLTSQIKDPAQLEETLGTAEHLFAEHQTPDGIRLPSVALICHAEKNDAS